jgi:hypothetical protein
MQSIIQRPGLDYFRRMVALVYREIGALKVSNHHLFASKANLAGGYFGQARKVQAKQLYKLSLTDTSITQTLERYSKRTGLTLEDAHEAFSTGNWHSASGVYLFGGPKWATITSVAIQLRLAIQDQNWPEVARLANLVETLEYNNGKIFAKFAQLD